MRAMNESSESADLLRVLEKERGSIVETACESIRHSRTKYESAGQEETRRRIEALYEELLGTLSSHDLGNVIHCARQLAAERFESGYDLSDVQGAFNALEEAAWSGLCARLQPEQRRSRSAL
jgi:hypothetical protein